MIDYSDENVELVKRMFVSGEIPVYSQMIKFKIRDIASAEAMGIKASTDYLNNLAKVHIFMEQFADKSKNQMLDSLFEEQLFATYEYLKEKYTDLKFEDIFNDKVFNNYDGIYYRTSDFASTEQAKTINTPSKYISFNPKSPIIDISSYNLKIEKAGTHETQHFITGDGTSDNFSNFQKNDFKNLYINEMCTEWNVLQIVKDKLDYIPYRIVEKRIGKDTLTFTTQSDAYIELVQLYEPLNIISGNRLQDIYYKKDFNLNNLEDTNVINGLQEIAQSYTKLYHFWDTKNKYLREDKFDVMMDKFASLSTYYVKDVVGLDTTTDLDSDLGKEKLREVKELFDSFESITFKKSSSHNYERDIIKEKILLSIFKEKEKASTILNDINKIEDEILEEVEKTAEKETTERVILKDAEISNNSFSFTPLFSEEKLRENNSLFKIECSKGQIDKFSLLMP